MPDLGQQSNIFRLFVARGYHRLTPVIPPGAPVAVGSALAARIEAGADPRGKVPGRQNSDGTWSGFDWIRYERTDEDLEAWAASGASVGVLAGQGGVIGIDIDILDPAEAGAVVELARRMLGRGAVRIGRPPKALLIFRDAGGERIPYRKIRLDGAGLAGALVETMTDGRQFVAHGLHPATGRPYVWQTADGLIPPLVSLPAVSADSVAAFFDALAERYPGAATSVSGSRIAKDQSTLAARTSAHVAAVMEALPNDADVAPTRDDWLKVGYALKGSLPEDPDLAFELFAAWSGRWTEGRNDPAEVEANWRRMKPPFDLGIHYLTDLAAEHCPDVLSWRTAAAEAMFGDIPDTEPETTGLDAAKRKPTPGPLPTHALSTAAFAAIPPRRWLYGRLVSRGYTTVVAGPGGVGKSSWTICVALAMASGRDLLHDKPVRPLNVWMLNLEDDLTEIRRRFSAAAGLYGMGDDTLARIHISSGRERPVCLLRATSANGSTFETCDDIGAMAETIAAHKIDVVIADPMLRMHQVPENSNEAQDEFMRIVNLIADRTGCGMLLVHHTRKGAEAGDAEGLRGGSAQVGAARAVITMTAMTVEEAETLGVAADRRKSFVRLDDAKNNMAPQAGNARWIRLEDVRLDNGTPDYPDGDQVQVAVTWSPPSSSTATADGVKAVTARLSEFHEALVSRPDGYGLSSHGRAASASCASLLVSRFGVPKAVAAEVVGALIKQGFAVVETRKSTNRATPRDVVMPAVEDVFS